MSTESEGGRTGIERRVDEAIDANEVVLFMKGEPDAPRCGFSQRAVGLVSQHRDDFEAVNVLDDLAAYREALEDHSGWTTIPQAYVDGEFVGGSDILAEHADRDELAERLNAE